MQRRGNFDNLDKGEGKHMGIHFSKGAKRPLSFIIFQLSGVTVWDDQAALEAWPKKPVKAGVTNLSWRHHQHSHLSQSYV